MAAGVSEQLHDGRGYSRPAGDCHCRGAIQHHSGAKTFGIKEGRGHKGGENEEQEFLRKCQVVKSLMVGCSGMEKRPEYRSGYLYYHTALVNADRALDEARMAGKDKECPEEFNALKDMVEKAYEVYITTKGWAKEGQRPSRIT